VSTFLACEDLSYSSLILIFLALFIIVVLVIILTVSSLIKKWWIGVVKDLFCKRSNLSKLI
jgi:hypothetical protein